MNPYPFAVVKLGTQHACRYNIRGGNGSAYVQVARSHEWVGEPTEDTCLIWTEDRATADYVVQRLLGQFPRNSYCVVQTTDVYYIPPTEHRRARFTDEGLLPV